MPSKPILRFAPSPNGHLHLGHAYSALFTNRCAEELGGTFLLRIEDTDLERSKPEFVAAIYEDLRWLGLSWPEPVMVQSARFEVYQNAIKRLQELDLVYPCFCSRSEIRERANGQTDPDGAPIYPGTCKRISKIEIAAFRTKGKAEQLRLDVEKAISKTGMLTFSVAQPSPLDRPHIRYANPTRWGDVVVARKDTPTSYHLAVVVDDAAQNITHVTRGRDMEAVTEIHVLLQFLLSLPSPIYTFHKLILGDNGTKLSKSKSTETLRDLRKEGWTADAVRARLGY